MENPTQQLSKTVINYPINQHGKRGHFYFAENRTFLLGIDNLERDSTDAKNTWFDKKFDDIGIGEVQGSLNGCPTQIIVVHAAGYIPPSYKKDDIESWKTSLSRLREIQPSWADLKNNSNFYQSSKSDVDRINAIISIRISNISTIVAKMEANRWLTASEQKMVDQDKALFDEQEVIATRLNSQH